MAIYTIKLERNETVIKFNVRTDLTEFRDILRHAASRRYGKRAWCQFDEYSRVRFFKTNRDGSSDGIRMPPGWLIVPINDCSPSEHDPVGCFMRIFIC